MCDILKFLLNEKIYLPIVYIVLGVIVYIIVKTIINKLSKKIRVQKGINKRKDTIVSLINNIIKYVAFDNDKYQLTKKARKKLTRMRKIIIFIDSKIFKKNKDK